MDTIINKKNKYISKWNWTDSHNNNPADHEMILYKNMAMYTLSRNNNIELLKCFKSPFYVYDLIVELSEKEKNDGIDCTEPVRNLII